MNSCLYEGTVTHHRRGPVEHSFSYSVFMLYLDLAELPGVFDGVPLWSARRPAPAWFRRADYLGDPGLPLEESVRALVTERLDLSADRRPVGPVRMLTNLRYWGHCFNPVTFYWLFDAGTGTVTHTVADVTNTPWGERHAYVAEGSHSQHRKVHHVSPFLEMGLEYSMHLPAPGERLTAGVSADRDGTRVFDASLGLRRRAISAPALSRLLLSRAPMTMKVSSAIYGEAIRLRLKGVRTHPHPRTGDRRAARAAVRSRRAAA